MVHKDPLRSSQSGFTIIELMIATMVFGVVLLLITTATLQITKVYYRGITEAKTQYTARSIVDLISQGIQFSGGAVTETTPSGNTFCVANQQYTYVLRKQLVDQSPTSNQTFHALVVRDQSNCPSAAGTTMNVADIGNDKRELIEPKMRLSRMEITSVTANAYRVTVKVVYGDDDILNNPNAANASCKSLNVGAQFCAVSELSTIVTRRVE